ncbi:MAG: 50S ribosomal protein L6 [Bacteroidia bacterium]|nr:50S ribosomal protein L6 [Bacteroidia bacterium]
MSRIGKLPISLPAGVTVEMSDTHVLTVKGPKGQLQQKIDPEMIIKVEKGTLVVARPSDSDQKRHKALHGLYRSLISNMVTGVVQGFKKEMEVIGVGYKAEAKGSLLELSLGYSHPIAIVMPPEVKVETETQRGQAPKITLTSIDKQLLGQMSAKIREMRSPEPYKGKGIRFVGEDIRRKAGKSAGKKK